MVRILQYIRLSLLDFLGGVPVDRPDLLWAECRHRMKGCREVWIEKNGEFYRLRIGKWAGYYTFSKKGLENMIASLIVPPGLEIKKSENHER